jgi:hypothetical protein
MLEAAVEKRSEQRIILDEYYSVQFSIEGSPFLYQFKIWDVSPEGMSLLVRQDSDLFKLLKTGDVVTMTYSGPEASSPTEERRSEIRHITRVEEGRFKGHCLVGFSILK